MRSAKSDLCCYHVPALVFLWYSDLYISHTHVRYYSLKMLITCILNLLDIETKTNFFHFITLFQVKHTHSSLSFNDCIHCSCLSTFSSSLSNNWNNIDSTSCNVKLIILKNKTLKLGKYRLEVYALSQKIFLFISFYAWSLPI